MLNHKTLVKYRALLIASDTAIVALSWLLAFYLRFNAGFAIPKGVPDSHLYLKLTPFIAIIWLLVAEISGFYQRSIIRRSAVREGLDIIVMALAAAMTFTAFTNFYNEYQYSRLTLVLFAGLSILGLIAGRSGFRKLLRRYLKKAPKRRVLLMGGGQIYHDFQARLSGEDSDYHLQAAISLEQGAASLPKNWPEFLSKQQIETAFIILEPKTHELTSQQILQISDQIPDIKIIPDVLKLAKFSPKLDIVLGLPSISIHESPLDEIGQISKRLMDIAGSLAALTIFSPFLLTLAVLVKLSSRGPVLYKQIRMGLDGKTFAMLKFRSMMQDSELNTGAIFATKNDQRTTWIGRLMRRTSLDELPQFFNVLVGHMSIVGPRPERPVFVEQFRNSIPGYMLRHKVKAGVTGWAQVNGWRGDTSIEKRIECDLFYIQNWSIRFDVKIIILTVLRGFIHKNAY